MNDQNNPQQPQPMTVPPNDAPPVFTGNNPVSSPPLGAPQPQVQQPIAPVQPIQEPVVQQIVSEPVPSVPAQDIETLPPPVYETAPSVHPISSGVEPQPVISEIPTHPVMPPVQNSPTLSVPESVSSPPQPEPIVPATSIAQPIPQRVVESELITTPVPVPQPIVQSEPSTQFTSAPVAPAVLPQEQISPVASVLTPAATQPVQQPIMPQGVPAASVAPAFVKKNKLPKIALLVATLLLVLSGLGFVLMQFIGGGTTGTVGTKGEITWWGVTYDQEIIAPLIEEYKGSHPDVTITYVKQSPTDYRERLTSALASGKGPDIFELHNTWPAMFRNDLATLPPSVMSPDEYKGTFYPVMVSDMTTAKGIVGIPLYYDAITLYVNEDLFSVALKSPPKTWIDMQALADPATGLTQKERNGTIIQSAVSLGTTDNVEYWPEILGLMMYQNKASFTSFESQPSKDTFAFYQYFGKTTGNWDSTLPKSTEAFAKQKTAMILAPASSAYEIIQQAPSLHFKTYPLPQLPKENPNDVDFAYATYWTQSVWTKSASKDVAWEFLKFMASGQTLQKINQNLKTASKPQKAYPIAAYNQQFANDPILGSVVLLAPVAKSWYLADKTNDGATGINTQLKAAFTKAVATNPDPKTAQTDVIKILTQYGITIPK